MQQGLYQRSDYNFVRLEFGRELPQDKDTDNKYTRAAATLEKWLQQGILTADKAPAIYIHDHHFTYQGRQYRRRSINCLVKLEEWNKAVIRPHEATFSKPKSDRLNLLWALGGNTSPIMALYEDQGGQISSLVEAQSQAEPALIGNADGEEVHHLWAVTDTEAIGKICGLFKQRPLYIADGHHRYESALTYQRERRSSLSSSSGLGKEPFDFVLMTLVDFDDAGLIILPAHRLIRGMSKSILENLRGGLETLFAVEEISFDRTDTIQQIKDLLYEETEEVKLILYGLTEENLLVLELHDFDKVSPMMPYFHSELYQKLDVSIVDHVILEELLGLTHDKTVTYIDYTNDARDAIDGVSENDYQLAIILNPVKPGVIKAIADSDDRMPRKSTYFYPKTPAGLIFYRFG